MFSFHSLSVPARESPSPFLIPIHKQFSHLTPLPILFQARPFTLLPIKNFADAHSKFSVLSKLSLPWHRHKNIQPPRTSQWLSTDDTIMLTNIIQLPFALHSFYTVIQSFCTLQLYLRKKWVLSDLSFYIWHTQCNNGLL